MNLLYVSLIAGFIALIVVIFLAKDILKKSPGNEKMIEVSGYIEEGAMAFLRKEYSYLCVFIVVVAIAILVFLNYKTAIAFVVGALFSIIAGYIGMRIAVKSNVRTAEAAKSGIKEALSVAFSGGTVMGLCVVGLGIIGLSIFSIVFDLNVEYITGFGLGASSIALFARVGGGIYTKAADVGADLVGKVEAGIPEDDPRNPAVIADLVGDNVGDCAGRGADLFESTAAENIGAMILGIALYPVFGVCGILFPLIARASGIIASIFGIFSVKTKEDKDPMKSLNKGYFITTVLCAIFLFPITKLMLSGIGEYANKVKYINFYGCAIIGLLLSFAFVYITQYYTSYNFRPVKEIAKSSLTGPATNIISGISVGLESTFAPVLVIAIAIFSSYWLGNHSGLSELGFNGGLYGTAIATMGMLSTCSYILAMDTFGPITDNAGGITEMSGAPEEMRVITDKLDACGNTTKALTKGYAVGSAALATFLLFSAYIDEVKASKHLAANAIYSVDIGKPEVFIGALIGAMVVFLFSSTAIRAVGKAAQYVILEVRRQFKEKPGIMDRKDKPDYRACVDIVTKGALKEMILPGVIVIVTPIAVGLILGAEAAGGMLMVATIVGVLMALFFNNGGGAWDNAKKFIELGNFGGKKSEAHKAGVVGDTVGDPFKDTAGPSIHVLIKLFSTITLVLATIFVTYGLM